MTTTNTLIIGGGFYGLRIALFLYDNVGVSNITIIEKEPTMMSRASYVNQARIHNGYHYPRSVLTGHRSAVNFPRFTEEYSAAVVSSFDKYYAIARHLSKVNARQFKRFCEKIGAEVSPSPENIKAFFSPTLIDDVFKVKEYAFNSHILRDTLLEQIAARPGIVVRNNEPVDYIAEGEAGITVKTDKGVYEAEYVLNCTYSSINSLHRRSHLPPVALKHEITEMCLVKMPDTLSDFSVTVMDGPFFSLMPFPSKNLYTLSHVRYTPHESWMDDGTPVDSQHSAPHDYLKNIPFHTNYKQMYNDVVRFIPALKDMEYVESIVEVKTVLVKSEGDDSRPILFKAHHGLHNYACIMGGKLDNIYDVFEELLKLYEATP